MRTLICLFTLLLALPGLARQDELSDVDEAVGLQAAEPEAAALTPPADEAPGMEWLRSPGFDTVVCPFRGEIEYEPGDIECGLIQVPENREVAGSRTIELHFVKVNARGENADGDEVDVRADPVIYLTGSSADSIDQCAADMGAYAVIHKPFQTADLLAAIHEALLLVGEPAA